MSFLSRLGLQSVCNYESNHGAIEENIQNKQLVPFEEFSDSELPDPVVLNGAIFQYNLITVFPGFEVHLLSISISETDVKLYRLIENGNAVKTAELFCDFFIGFNTIEARKTIGNLYVLSHGTHLLTLDTQEEDVSEFTLK